MKIYLKDVLNEEGPFDGELLVKSCDRCVSNAGKPYLNITLQDVTASVNGKKWTVEEGDETVFAPGNVVRVEGSMLKYKGAPQLKVEKAIRLEKGSYDSADFYLSCPINDEELFKEVGEIIDKIQDADLKKLTASLIQKNEDRYFTYPAAVTVHHAYRAGIVYHSLSIAKMALAVQEHYPQLNLDYLLSGALLHDIGKTKEMNGILATSYTLEGNLIGHISLGAEMVMEEGEKLGTDPAKLTVLVHMILAHHGEPDFGSPVLPQTPEAFVLHVLDDLDAKLNILQSALANVSVGEFSQRLPFLNGKAFMRTK